uniref:Uncharacterized protein n=1 Tax=Aegilops tauschii TaxID=37682 RepID=M8AUK6_AEGTA
MTVYIALLMNNPEHRGAPKECYIEPPSRVSTNNAPKRGRTLALAIHQGGDREHPSTTTHPAPHNVLLLRSRRLSTSRQADKVYANTDPDASAELYVMVLMLFCFYLRGARMTAMQEPGSKELSMIIFVRSEEESLNDFWYFMSVVKKNEVQRAKEMEYRHMQSRYDKEWEKVENQPWFRKLENLQDHLSNKAWVLIPGGLLLAGLGESSDWKLLRGPHAPPPGPGEEAPFEKNPVEDML